MNRSGTSFLRVTVIVAALCLIAWWVWQHRFRTADASAERAPATTATAPLERGSGSTANRAGSNVGVAPDRTPKTNAAPSVPPTFADAVAKLSAADAEYIKSVNTRLMGLLDYRSLAELQWKLERGFPSIEDVLALRGKPTPAKIPYDQLSSLTPRELSMHFLARTLAQPSPDKWGEEHGYIDDGLAQLRQKMDTPLHAYLLASITSPTDARNKGLHARFALEAALYGDPFLAESISEQLKSTDPETAMTAKQAYFASRAIAFMRTMDCANDRYTGNPRLVERQRRANEEAIAQGKCNNR
jgi:hypothetical protein